MSTSGKQRRRSRGSAWHWRQTDGWYFTPPGTKRRVPLTDEDGKRIRGKENRQAAELALARVKVAGDWRPEAESMVAEDWLVARVCSEYIEYCRRGVAADSISADYAATVKRRLNQLCSYCGTLPVSQLSKGHVEHWIESQAAWQSQVTRRTAIAIVLAAFNYSRDMHDIEHRLKGLKKPPSRPRLHSFTAEDEAAIYDATDEVFSDFVFAAIHTGLRPFCELARLTADDIAETDRGMMWRVYSSKTKKTRKIPVRRDVAVRVRSLIQSAPTGSGIPIFRNMQGNPWKKVTAGSWFRAIRKELGWDHDPVRKAYSCYTARHTFAHRMLSGFWNNGVGCSIETLAELIGDTPKVAFDHYGREWGQHYQDPLWAAIGVE